MGLVSPARDVLLIAAASNKMGKFRGVMSPSGQDEDARIVSVGQQEGARFQALLRSEKEGEVEKARGLSLCAIDLVAEEAERTTFTKNVIPIDTFGAVRDGHVRQHYLRLDPHFPQTFF